MIQSCNETYHECCSVQRLCVYRSCLYDCIVRKVVAWCTKFDCPTQAFGRPCVPKCALAYIQTTRVKVEGMITLKAQPYECTAPDVRRQRLFGRPILRRIGLDRIGKQLDDTS